VGKREELAALLGPAATTLLKQRQSISHAYTERKKIWDQQLNRDQQLLLLSPLPFPIPCQTCPSLSKASKTAQGAALPDLETLWTPKCLKQTLYAGN
jgi:hypothetical protein